MKGSRLLEIDLLKAIGIFLVVLGHLPVPDLMRQLIYSFHMPLFFFMSGFLQSAVAKSDKKKYLLRKFHRIILPYLYFNIITYIFWFFIGRKFGIEVDTPIPPLKPILGIFYGIGYNHYLVHCGHLWFLTCLFVVIVLYNLSIDSTKSTLYKVIVMIILGGIGFLGYKYLAMRLAWGIKIAFVASIFYIFGNLLREHREIILKARKSILIISCCILFVLTYLLSIHNGEVSMSFEVYHNYLIFILNALTGIMAFYILSILISTQNKIVLYTSQNSMQFYAFHQMSFSFVQFFYLFALGIPLSFLDNKILLNILNAIVVFLLLVPVVNIINKYFPWVVGSYRNTKKSKN